MLRRRAAGLLLPFALHLGLARIEAVAAPRGLVLAGELAQRPYVGHQLPDVIVRDVAAVGRHAVGAPRDDRVVDVLRLMAVDPLVVHQGRPHAAAAVGVAAGAVVPLEQTLALVELVRVGLVGRLEPGLRQRLARLQRNGPYTDRPRRSGRRGLKLGLLPLATGGP